VIKPKTLSRSYWSDKFAVADPDIEQVYNHLLDTEKPQSTEQIARVIVSFRIQEEVQEMKRRLAVAERYLPSSTYAVGDKLVMPAMRFRQGEVVGSREGYNPEDGAFTVINVKFDGSTREFASGLGREHALNVADDEILAAFESSDAEEIHTEYSELIDAKVLESLRGRPEFIRLGDQWFVQDLLAEVNIGHLHLTEAVLEVSDGGPLTTEEIMPHLDMDEALDPAVRRFSLNYALLNDSRFDEVAPPGQVTWFLRKMEPKAVRDVPEMLRYEPITYDAASLSKPLKMLERELDDEWSELESVPSPRPTIFSLTYPHLRSGTLPLNSGNRALFPKGISPRHQVILVDEVSGEEIPAWVVHEHRYVYGLGSWYRSNGVPVGGYVTLRPWDKPGKVLISFDSRKPKREWVRLAKVANQKIKFVLERRSIGCGYDDQMIVGTDVVSAVDAVARQAAESRKHVASILNDIFAELAALNPQDSVHAKTLYSAANLIMRVPPGPLFAELVNQPKYQHVGDNYWKRA